MHERDVELLSAMVLEEKETQESNYSVSGFVGDIQRS